MISISKVCGASLAVIFSATLCSCSTTEPSPPGSVSAKLERAGENYQATEADREARSNDPATR